MSIETIKLEFVEKAKDLLEIDPYISISDLLAKHKVIEPVRRPRPTVEEVKICGYYHREGEIYRNGKKLKPTQHKKTGYQRYSIYIPNFGSYQPNFGGGTWQLVIQAHTLVFLFTHNRYPLDGYVLDHIDGDKTNNHPDNLREVTKYENNDIIKAKKMNGIEIPQRNYETQSNLLEFFN